MWLINKHFQSYDNLAFCLQVNNHRIPCCYLGNIAMMKWMRDQVKGLMIRRCIAMKRYYTTYISLLSQKLDFVIPDMYLILICVGHDVMLKVMFLILIISLIDCFMVRWGCAQIGPDSMLVCLQFLPLYLIN